MYLPRSTEPQGKQLENKGGECNCIPEGREANAGSEFRPLILMLFVGVDARRWSLDTYRGTQYKSKSENYVGKFGWTELDFNSVQNPSADVIFNKKLAIHVTSGEVTFVVLSPDFFDSVCASLYVNTLAPLRPCDYILTGCHDCILLYFVSSPLLMFYS